MRVAAFLAIGAIACGGASDDYNPRLPERTTRASPPSAAASGEIARPVPAPDTRPDQVGFATWYGSAFAGRKTASGERFDPRLYTAAHRTLPFGTWVEVRRVDTGRAVRVRINDRGPFSKAHRIIDLSKKAADDLDMIRAGEAQVEIRVVSGP